MKFLYPYFLFALLTVSIPLVIHFFNFKRYKTVYFSQLAFLKSVQKENRKKSQLKHLLILFSRILTIIFLVIAFSQPYFPVSEKEKNIPRQMVAVYIDNSFSMQLEGEKGVSLEQARNFARNIAEAYRPGTDFYLLTNDFLPQHNNSLDRAQFINQVNELQISAKPVNAGQLIAQANQQFAKTGNKYDKSLFLLSDFQEKAFPASSFQADSSAQTYLVPFTPGKVNNLYIDSCWFELPGRRKGQAEKLFARIINSSDETYRNIPVRLLLNDSLKAISTITIAPGEQQTTELNFTANQQGFQFAELQLDDYPLTYDNSYFMAWEVKDRVELLCISDDNDPATSAFQALFSDDDLIGYEHSNVNNLQLSRIKNKHCVLLVNLRQISSGLSDELSRFIEQGGSVVIFPSAQADRNSYNELLSSMNVLTMNAVDTSLVGISSIRYDHPVFQHVFKKPEKEADLPKVRNTYSLNKINQRAETRLLELRNGQSALSVFEVGKGKIYLFTFPADNSNRAFTQHQLFVPALYNPVLNSISGTELCQSIGQQNRLLFNRNQFEINGSEPIKLKKRNSEETYLLNGKPAGANQIQLELDGFALTAGHYSLESQGKTIDALAFNYKRDESEPNFYTAQELNDLLKKQHINHCSVLDEADGDSVTMLREINEGKSLWKLFLLLAVFGIVAEMLIIRFYK